MSSRTFSAIVSLNPASYGIGRNGQIPWRLKEDLEYFKNVTSTVKAGSGTVNAVIMGRKTWESIPAKFRPLPDRINVVVSRDSDIRDKASFPDEVLTATSLDSALNTLSVDPKIADIFVIGGEALYREAVASPSCTKLYITEVFGTFTDLDTFFPAISAADFSLEQRSTRHSSAQAGVEYRYVVYKRITDEPVPAPAVVTKRNTEELQYLDLLRDIINTGVLRGDRTGTGTVSKFGVQMRFNLRDNVIPLITTKRVFWRGVAEELLWFVHGSTNARELQEKNIHIWDGNASRQFLDSRGLHSREEGDLGPVYGFQWRHFGAKYVDMHTDYTGQGIDQLRDCLDKIKHNPEDRRIIMTAWNPADLSLMALPPCHMFCQFYVANNELSCHMYQRSADMGLGVPFNIASYALLTRLMAQACGLQAGDFVHSIGDAHVYVNHIDALKVQLQREPKAFPKLLINPAVTDIDAFTFADFTIEGYNPDASIKMDMAV